MSGLTTTHTRLIWKTFRIKCGSCMNHKQCQCLGTSLTWSVIRRRPQNVDFRVCARFTWLIQCSAYAYYVNVFMEQQKRLVHFWFRKEKINSYCRKAAHNIFYGFFFHVFCLSTKLAIGWCFLCVLFFLLATEIRCQEKSKGGLCYEVILGQPVAIPPLKQNKIPTMTKKVSAAEIERKLSEAEKRRLVRIIAYKYPLQPPLGINDSQQCFRYNGFCSPSLSFSLAI